MFRLASLGHEMRDSSVRGRPAGSSYTLYDRKGLPCHLVALFFSRSLASCAFENHYLISSALLRFSREFGAYINWDSDLELTRSTPSSGEF